HIEFTPMRGGAAASGGRVQRGTYQLTNSGRTLRCCVALPDDPRPTKFDGTPKGLSVLTFKQDLPIVGTWIEAPQGGRPGRVVREFQPDGTFVLHLTNLELSVTGTWKSEGERIYFSHPATGSTGASEDKWFTISSMEADSATILMMGTRPYEWQKSLESSRDE